jgi:UDP-N-acetylmuramate dehydrogenase
MINPFSDLRHILRTDEPMARHTSLRVGGTVRYFLEPTNTGDFHRVYQRGHQAGLRVYVIGRGCNVLVEDGPHHWAVICTAKLNRYIRTGNRIWADAGVSLHRLVTAAEEWGLGGLEALAGIPGSLGGAVAMNAGGIAGSVSDRLVSATVAFPGGLPREVNASELGLGYRSSYLIDGRPCLLSATFDLDEVPTDRLRAARKTLEDRKHASQPMDAYSAGCFFKNPPGASAGKLIDDAGLKGTVVGGAIVSEQHANFLLNRDRATAADIFQLIDLVVQRVREVHGVTLELEVKVWREQALESPPLSPEGKERLWASTTSRVWPSSTAATPTSATSPSEAALPSAGRFSRSATPS